MFGSLRFFFKLFILSFCIISFSYSSNYYPDIKVLESNSSGIILEFIPRYFSIKTIHSGEEKYDLPDFENSIPYDYKSIGAPDTRYRNITIGMPFLSKNTIEIISADYETLNNINLPPLPGLKKDENTTSYSFYQKDKMIYDKNTFYPSEIALLKTPDISRDRIIGNLALTPLQYNPVTKELKKYTRIRIRINFNGNNPKNIVRTALSQKDENEHGSGNIINDAESRNWRVKENVNSFNKAAALNSVLSSGEWYKIEIQEEGMIKLDAAFFKAAGIDITKVNPQTIKIYGNGGEDLAESLTAQRIEDLAECAIYVSGESDASFDSGDYILFYGKGPNGWNYNSGNGKYYHYLNHFSNSNYYFLTFGGNKGKRMATFNSLTDANATKVTSLTGQYYIEPEVNNLKFSGKEWFGDEIKSQASISFSTSKIDGLLIDQPVTYRILCAYRSGSASSFNLDQNNQSIGQLQIYSSVDLSNETGYYALKSNITEFNAKTDIKDNKFNLKLTYNSTGASDLGYLDWIEIFYPRSLSTAVDEISFNTPSVTGNLEYNLDGFSTGNIFVFKVDDHNNVKILSNPNISGSNIKFQISSEIENPSKYFVTGNKGYKGYVSVKKLSANSNLHGITDGAEFIIITHPDFLSQAEEYKTYRESSLRNSLKTKIFNINDIYNEFAGGLPDPTAIRDFIRYSYNNWNIKPQYLLLFGEGNYQYRKSSKIKIPVYETDESLHQIDSYTSDDFFVRIIGGGSLGYDTQNDLAVGRIPINDETEAKTAIEKIKSYETNNSFSAWRNTMTFVADDWYHPSQSDGHEFTLESEYIAEKILASSLNKKKIYTVEYPTVIGFSGRTKPDANKDIIDQINRGTLILNYIGHGAPDKWADEGIFIRDITIPLLTNKDKLPFILAATCDFGRYDNPSLICSPRILQNKSDGGTIGVFTPTRSVFSPNNFTLSCEFYRNIFELNTDHNYKRIGDVIYSLKQTLTGINDDKFNLIGDPTIRIAPPVYAAKIDSINGQSPKDTVRLKALSKVSLKGKIMNDSSKQMKGFNGKLNISLKDASKSISIYEDETDFDFVKEGGLLFTGEFSVKNGEFNSSFFIPKDISYEKNCAKISLYFSNDTIDGSGYNNNIIISGADSLAAQDNDGPVILAYMDDKNFRDGDMVGENPKLIIDLSDESGINLSEGIGHRLQAWLDGSLTSINLNNYYSGIIDASNEGAVEYRFSDLADGNHRIKVKAFDVFNNSSQREISFKVSNQNNLTIKNVLNYPNPFSKFTKFTFEQNQDVPIDVTIKIYTVSGRLIKSINEYGIREKFVQIEWDGKDDDADDIANGIYLYKVISKTEDGKFTNESLGKLSIIK
jgi:hypothetical protein